MNITKCHRLTPKEAADKGRQASNTPTKKQVNEKRKIFLHITHISRNNQWNKQSLNGSFELSNFSHILSSFREKIFVSKKKENSSTCCPLSFLTNTECNPDLTIHTNLKLMARFVDLFILLLLFLSKDDSLTHAQRVQRLYIALSWIEFFVLLPVFILICIVM